MVKDFGDLYEVRLGGARFEGSNRKESHVTLYIGKSEYEATECFLGISELADNTKKEKFPLKPLMLKNKEETLVCLKCYSVMDRHRVLDMKKVFEGEKDYIEDEPIFTCRNGCARKR
ncbi:MAG: hypothetical protein WA139_00795 [Candidatus Aenigmatarchaeota archaeon]